MNLAPGPIRMTDLALVISVLTPITVIVVAILQYRREQKAKQAVAEAITKIEEAQERLEKTQERMNDRIDDLGEQVRRVNDRIDNILLADRSSR